MCILVHNMLHSLFVGLLEPFQHLRSYLDGYQVVTVRTHNGDIIVLCHSKTRLLAPCLPLSHIIFSLSYAERPAR